ncbi:MAG: ParB/RepB/Spo0J family partition protein [Spirochaetaceae bacterium]|nr:ParB/RepB/Spo0J family partition protein [Spirochaetaceae bacterium]
MAKQFGLGKGLGALIPDPDPVPIAPGPAEGQVQASDAASASAGDGPVSAAAVQASVQGGVLRVPLSRVEPNPEQPRKTFSEASIAELADSIRRHGLIQPIVVEDSGEGRYRIVAGERRWRAANVAALRDIPVIVRSFSPEKRLEIGIIENVQREDLNPVEEAEAYRALMDLTGCTQEEVADKVGKSRPAVANALRLLKLPVAALASLRDGKISPGHARALLSVQDPGSRELLFARLLAEELSVRQAEAAAQDLNRGLKNNTARVVAGAAKEPESREAEIVELEGKLIGAFGTKVAVKGDSRRGTIQIEYYSLEDLERIIGVVSGEGR